MVLLGMLLPPPSPALFPSTSYLPEFLRDLGLSDYEDLLRETGFDDHESLLAIEEDDMDAIGMITGHKRKLLRAVAELSERLQEEGLLAGDSRFARTGASAGAGRPTRRASLEMRRDSAAPGSTDGDGSDGGGGADDASAKKRKPKEKRRRRRRADEMPPKPLTLEEKAAAGVVGASEVVLETVFPGDDLNFPQDGEIARVHYTCKVGAAREACCMPCYSSSLL
jgi:hypothetical protein